MALVVSPSGEMMRFVMEAIKTLKYLLKNGVANNVLQMSLVLLNLIGWCF